MLNSGNMKRRAEAFKSKHGLKFAAAEEAPAPAAQPVPWSDNMMVSIDGVEFLLSPRDMECIGSLGSGVHGTVDKMKHKPTGRIVAVKRIAWRLNSPEHTTLLHRELEVSMQASLCPQVVKCYGALYYDGAVWICMEVMDTSLEKFYRAVFSKGERIPESFLGVVAASIVTALQYLKSELRVIHRDVKPSNILVNRNGDVRICDFGISGRLVDSIAKSHVGSRNYMAPERVQSSEDQQGYDITSDVWSLGISMMELATGIFPYDAWKTPFDQIQQVVSGPPPRLPAGQFSPEFEDFIAQCLQKDYRSRPKYTELLQHPFIVCHYRDDVSSFVSATFDNIAIH